MARELPPLRDMGRGAFDVQPTEDGGVDLVIWPGLPHERHMLFRPDVAWQLSTDIQRAAQTAERIVRNAGRSA